MSAYGWSAAPRRAAGIVEVVGAGCFRCGRQLYVDVRGDHPAGCTYEHERCRGCDEIAPDCYCPSATGSA